MSRFFWVRHGPTHAKAMVGWTDLPADLSDRAQLDRLHAHLPHEALVISSDLSRAASTADAITRHRTRLPHDPDLREINFGAWEMKGVKDVEDQDHLRAYWETPGDIRAPGGESWNDVTARVNAAVARLLSAYPGRDIVAVAHFGVILTQVQTALGLSAYQAFSHKIENLSVTEVCLTDGQWRAGAINHLP
ncbi:histidine phosphatase family protein [Thalassovita sp.]|jgi:broad specificity phosphatase PhoE|uniref:histidine phosphatase family protein n=1 Tax=Thalassovita sp. TaxID=1979401 RepID=UPI003B5934DF